MTHPTPAPAPSTKLSKRKLLLIIAGVVGLVLLWFVYQLFGPSPPVVIAKETTYITRPLGDDGLPDYGAALLESMREGVTPENNAAVLVWRATWPGELGAESIYAAALCQAIGLSPAPDPESGIKAPQTEPFVSAIADWLEGSGRMGRLAREAERGFQEPGSMGRWEWRDATTYEGAASRLAEMAWERPWSAEDLPPMAAWVRQFEPQLDMLVEAAARPRYYSPPPNLVVEGDPLMYEVLLPDVQGLRSAARFLLTRAMHRLGEGDAQGAWRDCRAAYGLGRHAAASPFLVSKLVSIACIEMASEGTLHVLSDTERLSPELAQEIHEFLASFQPGWDITKTIDRQERFGCLDMVVALAQHKRSASDMLSLNENINALNVVSVNWNFVLAEMNTWYDRIAAAGRQPTWSARQTAFKKVENDLRMIAQPQPAELAGAVIGVGQRSQLVADVVAALMLPAVSSAYAIEQRADSDLELIRLAAAVAAYRARTGAYPETLAEIAPAAPLDLFGGKPYVYRRTDDGFLLYSLGADGTDQGGSREQGQWGDMLFEGRPTERLTDPGDVVFEPGLDPWYKKISAGADDMAVRLRALVPPWPWEAPAPEADEGADSDGSGGSE